MKKRQLIIFIITLLGSWLCLLYLPWWGTIAVSFATVLCLQNDRDASAFLLCGLAGALAWTGLCVLTDYQNQFLLSSKMAVLFHLPSSKLLWPAEAIIGFISAGLGGWAARCLKSAFRPKQDPITR
ncbi:MAG TPA: hypothetical protein VFL76_08630 [Edaphocola sp.]|nr:hypothetical protein [Edaphocola sp.]